jgi:hypothetical protein
MPEDSTAVVEGASSDLRDRPIVTIYLIASLKDVSFGSVGDSAACYSSRSTPSARDFGHLCRRACGF